MASSRTVCIAESIRNGHPRAGQLLHKAYFDRLVALAQVIHGFRLEDAEELADDVLLAILTNRERVSGIEGEEGMHWWLMAIFRNKAIDRIRAASRERAKWGWIARFEPGKEWETVHGMVHGIIDDDGQRESLESTVVHEVLDVLEPWERSLLVCRALEMPYSEISSYTGKSVAQLKVYHSRVLRKFEQEVRRRRDCYLSST